MGNRLIAKFAVITTAAVMGFGLFSMAVSMEMGMSHCPVMRTTPMCPSRTSGIAFFDHHVEGFQSMTLATAAVAALVMLAVFSYFRISSGASVASMRHRYEHHPLPNGPPSPVADLIVWAAMHNKVGFLAPVKVHASRA